MQINSTSVLENRWYRTTAVTTEYNPVFRLWRIALAPPTDESGLPTETPRTIRQNPLVQQLAVQFAATFTVLSVAWPFFVLRNEVLPWPETSLTIGVLALIIARIAKLPWWWQAIHSAFTPLAWGVHSLSINPGWFLLAFIILLLVYRGALTGQIPLYLSNRNTVAALLQLTTDIPGMKFIDLGAGVGSTIHPLAKIRTDAQFVGVENAPATWLVGYLRTLGLRNCHWRWGDIWETRLSDYNVVYVFLSPAPMTELWAKAQREMQPGSLLISNSFPIPGVETSNVIEIGETRQTRLYCYRLD